MPRTWLSLHYSNPANSTSLAWIVSAVCPGEVDHLGAQSHVRGGFVFLSCKAGADARRIVQLLEAEGARQQRAGRQERFCEAASSDMVG